MSYLLAGSNGTTAHVNHFDAETHHLDDNFLAAFASSSKQHLGGTRT
jgi:hypothetical protein